MRRILSVLSLALSLSLAHGQTIRVSCPKFMADAHQRIACIEALLSQDKYHFTLASVPPSNGFGPGLVLNHTFRGTIGSQAQEDEVNISATGAVTTNSSWYLGGDLTWTLPFLSSDTSTAEAELASATQKNWHGTAIHLQAAHRTVRTIYFYGLGSGSPSTRYLYPENDTWGEVDGRVLLSHQFVLTGQIGARSTTLPVSGDPAAVVRHLSSTQAPGLDHQPLFVQGTIGLESRVFKRVSHPIQLLPVGDPKLQPLWKMEFENNVAFHFEEPTDGSPYAFRQFRFDGDERLNLRGWLSNSFPADQHPFTYHFLCQEGNKQRGECNLLQFDIKSRLVLTGTSAGNQIPFYLQPTLGGSDIDNRTTLRGWNDYRFRDRNLALIQLESNFIVWDPFGVYVFYDAGTVGNQAGDLALSRFRQDGGLGASMRLRGSTVAQTYYAWGQGHGGRWSFNFSKVF
jgi:hypothetical protein